MSIRDVPALPIAALVLTGCAAGRAPAPRDAERPAGLEIFVALDGGARSPGTRDAPLASIEGARDRLRARGERPRGGVTVTVRGGTYYLGRTVTFGPEDSGTADAPIVYRAAPGETVTLSAGRRLVLEWTCDESRRCQAPVAEGITFDQLFVDGERQVLARFPNFDPAARYLNGASAEATAPERVRRWAAPAGGFVHALHGALWGGFHYRITGVNADGTLALDGGWQNNRPERGPHAQHRFVENVREELDAPGEWYLDAPARRLFYLAPRDVDVHRALIEASGHEGVLELRGDSRRPVRHLSFDGFRFAHTARTFMKTREPLLRSDWTIHRGGAVVFEGTEDCHVTNAFFDAVGGNAVMISGYNRRATVSGCRIRGAGASGIAFVGRPSAVRSPAFHYRESVPLAEIDRTPGPRGADYPADCVAHDNLIQTIGAVEKQTAGITIHMSQAITVRHNTIHDVPRAGINVGDGCWGGHVIEWNDVFDTVKETGDHGAFNSWGRDRFWHPTRATMDAQLAAEPSLADLDAVAPIVLRHNRWHCEHGWDVDLDDGSSHYVIHDNLMLRGGLKLREGVNRRAESNVVVGNTVHPHVWFPGSRDVIVRNVLTADYRPIRMPAVWGREVDFNLLASEAGLRESQAAGRDRHSAAGDALFLAPARGDYRVAPESPAAALGFQNFPMDRFGVVSPRLRAMAGTPPLVPPAVTPAAETAAASVWRGATVKRLEGDGERSAAGRGEDGGVLLLEVPAQSDAARSGLQRGDVIVSCDGKNVPDLAGLRAAERAAAGVFDIVVYRNQQPVRVEVRPW